MNYQKYFVGQKTEAECGVSCLITVFKFLGYNAPRELIVKLSGTSNNGTSLLGIHEAAIKLGLKSEGYEGTIEDLKGIHCPSVLHVLINDSILHYVVCLGYCNGKFTISDPARGIIEFSDKELEQIWKSKRLLLFDKEVNTVVFNEIILKAKRPKKLRLFNLVEYDLNYLIPIILLGLIISVLGLSIPLFMKFLIDDFVTGVSSVTRLGVILLILFTTLFIRNLLIFLREYVFLNQSIKFNKRTTGYFFKKLLNLPVPYFDSMRRGDLITRMNDTLRMQSAVKYFFGSLVIEIFIFLAGITFIGVLLPLLAAIVITLSILFLLLSYYQTKKVIQAQKLVIESYAYNESSYMDSLTGIEVIKSSNKESFFNEITKRIFGVFQKSVYDLEIVRNKFSLIYSLFASLLIIISFSICCYEYINQVITLGEIIALFQVSILIIPSLINISLSNFRIQEAKVAFERINEFAITEPEYDFHDDSQKVKIQKFETLEVKNLNFKFPGTYKLIESATISIKKGDVIAVAGASGNGKSTLLKIFQKFYDIPNEIIFINGYEWNNISVNSWREKIGVVQQEIKIFSGSVAGNICLEEQPNRIELENFCKKIDLHAFFERLPDSYNTILGESGINISGGQKQLIGLARALYKKPELLFLDESTSFLDKETQTHVFNHLTSLAKADGLTILYVTHNQELLSFADKILHI